MNFIAKLFNSTPTLVKRFVLSLLLVVGLVLINKGVTGNWKPDVEYIVNLITPNFDLSKTKR
jgi:hypothetical protein